MLLHYKFCRLTELQRNFSFRQMLLRPIPARSISLKSGVSDEIPEIRRQPGRPRKTSSSLNESQKPKRPVGRPRKTSISIDPTLSPRRPVGRPRKTTVSLETLPSTQRKPTQPSVQFENQDSSPARKMAENRNQIEEITEETFPIALPDQIILPLHSNTFEINQLVQVQGQSAQDNTEIEQIRQEFSEEEWDH